MTHFYIFVAVKLHIGSNKRKKMDAHVKCEYCSKGDHYTVKDYDMIKYFQVVELYKNCHKIYHK